TRLLAGAGLADVAELPEREKLETRLEEALSAQGDTPSDAAQRDVEALKAALDGLEKRAQVERQRSELNDTLEQAPQELEQLNRALDAAGDQQSIEASIDSLENMSLEELEQQLAQATTTLQKARDRLAETEIQLLGARTLP